MDELLMNKLYAVISYYVIHYSF